MEKCFLIIKGNFKEIKIDTMFYCNVKKLKFKIPKQRCIASLYTGVGSSEGMGSSPLSPVSIYLSSVYLK